MEEDSSTSTFETDSSLKICQPNSPEKSSKNNDENFNNDDFVEHQQQKIFDILENKSIKVDEKFVIKVTKESKCVNREAKESCKVLHFSSEFNFDEVVASIDELNPTEYPNLFIFIIDSKNFGFRKAICDPGKKRRNKKNKKVKKIKEKLQKFGATRPLLLQLTSKDENVTKIFYKEETTTPFFFIDQEQKYFGETKNFSSFFCSFVDGKFINFENEMIEILPQVQNLSLIFRFLRTLNLNEEFFWEMVLKVSKNCTKAEFLASLDAPFESNRRMLSNTAQVYISNVFCEDEPANDLSNDLKPEIKSANDDSTSVDSQENQEDNSHLCLSVLLVAVENNNVEVVDYLITYWTHLIQQLPFKHQVKISTTVFETNQLDVLCDLLEIADFPFPENFEVHKSQVVHEKLLKIVADRTKFEAAIEGENIEEIDKFIDNNLSLKIVYSPANKSAMKQTADLKKYKVYYYLKSLGFKATEFNSLEEFLNGEELREAKQCRMQQRRKNVNEALPEDQKSVNLLTNRSFIHNRKISKEQAAEYRKKYRKWYEDISKIQFGAEFLNIAASCEHLKIIFDFECNSVENVSFQDRNTLGSMYPSSKWIFVGAKLSDKDGNETKKCEQQIKGVLAHELCHYDMKLIFENKENPYYKHREDMKEMFEEIVKVTDKWSTENSENPDDECNKIISSVFKYYERKDFHPELIVRVVQILSEFDDDEGKSKHLQEKYKILFDFWEHQVIPELRQFNLKNRENVRKINRLFELLEDVKNKNLEFTESKDIKGLLNNKLTVVTTNVPQLLIINIHNHLQIQYGDLFDTMNVFADPEKLRNQEILSDFKLLTETPKLNIFIDCSSTVLSDLSFCQESNSIFIMSSEGQCEELLQNIKDSKISPTKMEINYNWKDLTTASQKKLLQTKINFQNNSELALYDLLTDKSDLQEMPTDTSEKNLEEEMPKDFSEIIDDHVLNLLVKNSKISISTEIEGWQEDKNWEFLFLPRKFVRKGTENEKISEKEIFNEVKNQKYVLISDMAGNGKTWTMKNITKILRIQNPARWVTYVDLKQYIDEFKAKMATEEEVEFSTFITEKIFKSEQKFDAAVFKRLYKDGKVFIIFDGFDEIAPNCAEFVSKLAQSFEWNGGNQLWIATRDYFEVDLQHKLQLGHSYKLCEFTNGDGINLIALSWMLVDLKDKNVKTKDEFYEYGRNSSDFIKYQKMSIQIVQKIEISRSHQIGLPMLFKMIADGFKDDKEAALNIKGSEVYKKYINNLYERWSYEKGQLRKDASIKSQENELNFWKFHQFSAIESLFPEVVNILFPDYDRSEWSDEEIVACGLMSKMGEKFYFMHETLCEFFLADFIVKALKKDKIKDKVLKIFVEILTAKKFGVVRIFLNNAIDNYSTMEKIQPKVQKDIEKIIENSNYVLEGSFHDLFTKDLGNLAFLMIGILKNGNYGTIKKLLDEQAEQIVRFTDNPKLFLMFQEFWFDNLKVDDLKEIIVKQKILHRLICSSLNIKIFENFLTNVEEKTNRGFIKERLMTVVLNYHWGGNIFYYLCDSSNLSPHKIQKCLEIMQNYFTCAEIIELMTNCNNNQENIFIVCVQKQKKEGFKNLWIEIEKFCAKSLQSFKSLVMTKNSPGPKILHCVAMRYEIEIHQTCWELLLKTFKNREELKDFILQKNGYDGQNFIHKLVAQNLNPLAVKLAFQNFKENFTDVQYLEIIKSRGTWESNLLHTAAYFSKDIKVYQLLWKTFRDSCESEGEFVKILKETDVEGRNILHLCTLVSPKEIFEFTIEELEKVASRDEIRIMLKHLDQRQVNLLQKSAALNRSSELHDSIWKTYRKYFQPSEILELIKHVDADHGENILFCAARWNSVEMIELTWKEIKSFMDHDEQVEFLKVKNKCGNTLFEKTTVNTFPFNKDRIEWIRNLMHEYEIET